MAGAPFDVSRASPGLPDPGFSPEEQAALLAGPPPTIGRARAPRHRGRTGAWPPAGAPRVSGDSLESVADDVAYWIETTAVEVANAMKDGADPPFAARISPQEGARYYGESLFGTDGTLDPTQWRKEYQRLGPMGLADAIKVGAAWRRQMGLRVNLPVSRFQPTGAGLIGTTPARGSIPLPSEGESAATEPEPDRSVSDEDEYR